MSKKTTAVSAPSTLSGSLEQVSGKKPNKTELIELMARAMLEENQNKREQFQKAFTTLKTQALELLRGIPNQVVSSDHSLQVILREKSDPTNFAHSDLDDLSDHHGEWLIHGYAFVVSVSADHKDPAIKKLNELVEAFRLIPKPEYRTFDYFKDQLLRSHQHKYDFDKLAPALKAQLLDHAHTLVKGAKQTLDI